MDILNALTEDEFNLVTSRIRRLSGIAMMWEDVSDRNDPRVNSLLYDLVKPISSVQLERPEDERPGFFGIILRLFGIYLFIKISQVLFWGPI